MSKKFNSSEALEAMAYAIENVPGFARIIWNATDQLQTTWFALETMRNYEVAHGNKRGAYRHYKSWQETSSEAFAAYVNAANIILESMCSDDDKYCMCHYVVLSEVELLAKTTKSSECGNYARHF